MVKKKRCEECGHCHWRVEKKKDWKACPVKGCGCASLVVGGKKVG